MDWELIIGRVESCFGSDRTALAAAIHEVELSRSPAYLDAILVEEGSPADREEAVVWWSKRRGLIWSQ